jgi:hypothetical protein
MDEAPQLEPESSREEGAREEARNKAEDTYKKEMRRRIRRTTVRTRTRLFTMQMMWVVVLAAGAAVPLATALKWHAWVGPVLGFVVVVASGTERIYGRTTPAAVAWEKLNRELDRQTRLFNTSTLEYAEYAEYARRHERFALYVKHSEKAIRKFDKTMLAYTKSTLGESTPPVPNSSSKPQPDSAKK